MNDWTMITCAAILALGIGISGHGSNGINYDRKFCERVSKDVEEYIICNRKTNMEHIRVLTIKKK